MNISYKWLKRLIDFDLAPRDLAAAFTSLGLECDTVEEVESIRGGLKGIVIGKVLTCTDHPDSDHLHITTCDLGTGEPVQIVCGAPNVAAGQKVVVATVGTVLYDGDREFAIKKSKIRGVESFGMICAEDEIGIGKSHDGIMVLEDAEEVVPGTPAAEYFRLESDYCLEVELTPNRVDAASHYGTARDLRAYIARHNFENGKSEIPEIRLPEIDSFATDRLDGAVDITVEDKQGCPRYGGITVRGVKVGESPEWLRNLLISVGQRPINNIVDITNFMILGIGQPLHCFDVNKLAGEKIVVRTCEEGTPFTTLDGVEHKLSSADLMICDAEKPVAMAGVFGGLDSGVTESTTDVFIESAYFNPTRVRKTARRHGLSTDASFRYERGTDPNIIPYAAKLAAVMIKELAGGEICGTLRDTHPEGFEPFDITLSLDYCEKLIGKQIPRELIIIILKALDIEVLAASNDKELYLSVPRYKVDVTRPCDVVEEILRVYGYNNVEFGLEMHATLSQRAMTDVSYELQDLISDALSASGFNEILNNSLTAVSYYEENEQWPLAECVSLMNPLSRDLGVMRQTLLYGGLETISHNANRKNPDLKLYEFGNIYHRNPEAKSTDESPLAPYSEGMHLALWMTGNDATASWNHKPEAMTFFDLRAVIDNIFRRLGISQRELVFTQKSNSIMPAELEITTRSGKLIGHAGILSAGVLKKFDIDNETLYAELDWNALMSISANNKVKFTPLPKTQPVRRDLALLIDKEVPFSKIEECVRKAEKKLLRSVNLFDVYEGKNLPEGKKSYAIGITLQDDEKTLKDKQIDAVMKKIVSTLENGVGAKLR